MSSIDQAETVSVVDRSVPSEGKVPLSSVEQDIEEAKRLFSRERNAYGAAHASIVKQLAIVVHRLDAVLQQSNGEVDPSTRREINGISRHYHNLALTFGQG